MQTPLTAYLDSIAVCAPGIPDWPTAQTFFTTPDPDVEIDTTNTIPKAEILSPRERRRSTDTTNLALHVANTALQNSHYTAEQLRKVFASSHGDVEIFDYICKELSSDNPALSPTKFHHSLHNSTAGYWDICSQSKTASISISNGNTTFSGGLLEALVQCVTENSPVLLVCYDLPSPPPMDICNPMSGWFALGLILSAQASEKTLAKLEVSLTQQAPITAMSQPHCEVLRSGNPAAASLPLLHAIANAEAETVILDYLQPQRLQVRVQS